MVVVADGNLRENLAGLEEIVLEELNVKKLRFGGEEDVLRYSLKPNLSVVGPKYGRLVPGIRRALEEAPQEVARRAASGEPVTVSVEGKEIPLQPEELLVESGPREGYAVESETGLSVALSTELNPELVDEGLVRELVHKVQNLRREKGFEIEESIAVSLSAGSRLRELLEGPWGDYFRREVLAGELDLGGEGEDVLTVDGEEVRISLRPLSEDVPG